mmetsp:Transcript_1192/g.4910  ORF Transcript_1192/g.4910 Transcript_1192/m.4910 type:complete len:109 (+) Transcript_1192:104-430(+)
MGERVLYGYEEEDPLFTAPARDPYYVETVEGSSAGARRSCIGTGVPDRAAWRAHRCTMAERRGMGLVAGRRWKVKGANILENRQFGAGLHFDSVIRDSEHDTWEGTSS